ncbi:polyamine aminopropyltransferase [Sunxiuqinia dokdonensis]|uniref:Spermidine synthase n=1 Tax=Sunxiuqinia dokdonensis TaxID=1409788 RepID=A0A0L8V850_9BACT|nr:hypothetical protein [Sunxiuqinia dokdonensis]KOH44630.1 hypothetical protein NC99_25380 [Sunxiuqinia dokdonensis]
MTKAPVITGGHVGIGVGLLSAALIAFQLALMQIFSITQWYHFAHLMISLALLGFGASGTFLAFCKERLVRRFDLVYPSLLVLTAAPMALAPVIIQTEFFRFDTYLLFSDHRHLFRLVLTCLFLLLPFFFGALAIGLSFVRYGKRIGQLYFANLLGSGLGGLLALALMWRIAPASLPAILAILPLVGSFVARAQKRNRLLFWLCLILLIFLNVDQPKLVRSEYKSIEKTLLLPEAEVVSRSVSPYGLLEVVSTPALRYAPGLSLAYEEGIPSRLGVFNNGDALGVFLPKPEADATSILQFTTNALPYVIRQPRKALILSSGTGELLSLAVSHQINEIDAVEANPLLVELLQEEFADSTNHLLADPAIDMHQLESRTFVQGSQEFYDLIQLPVIGSFFGSSGLNALEQRYDLTREAFAELWQSLAPDGLISITCWMDYPVRNPLKILATLSDLLEGQVEDKNRHLAAIRSWSTVTFVIKKTAYTEIEDSTIREFCGRMFFDPLLLPVQNEFDREHFNQLDDPWFFDAVDQLVADSADPLDHNYAFRIRPATDDQPYFFQYLRLKSLRQLNQLFGDQTVPFMELGYVVVWLTLLLVVLASLVFILLPLLPSSFRLKRKLRTFLYFGGIGLGYLFVEMVFIQQFTPFLGHPIYAASGVISLMLLSSGVGSLLSGRIRISPKNLTAVSIVIAAVIIVYAFNLTAVLRTFNSYSMPMKIGLMILIVGTPALLMGLPFPLGLTDVSKRQPSAVPWAWAVNGCASVVSASLAIVISVEAGFFWVMVGAAAAYGLAALAIIPMSYRTIFRL